MTGLLVGPLLGLGTSFVGVLLQPIPRTVYGVHDSTGGSLHLPPLKVEGTSRGYLREDNTTSFVALP